MIFKAPAIYIEDEEVVRNFRINITNSAAFRAKMDVVENGQLIPLDILVSNVSSPHISVSSMSIEFDINGQERKRNTNFVFRVHVSTSGLKINMHLMGSEKNIVKEFSANNADEFIKALQVNFIPNIK